MKKRQSELEAELRNLKKSELKVDYFDVNIAHKSGAGTGDVPLDENGSLVSPQPVGRGKTYGEIVACWMICLGHYSNSQIFNRVGELQVVPADGGKRVIFRGAAIATLEPTNFRVFVLYRE
jgi:hypothetical protein